MLKLHTIWNNIDEFHLIVSCCICCVFLRLFRHILSIGKRQFQVSPAGEIPILGLPRPEVLSISCWLSRSDIPIGTAQAWGFKYSRRLYLKACNHLRTSPKWHEALRGSVCGAPGTSQNISALVRSVQLLSISIFQALSTEFEWAKRV